MGADMIVARLVTIEVEKQDVRALVEKYTLDSIVDAYDDMNHEGLPLAVDVEKAGRADFVDALVQLVKDFDATLFHSRAVTELVDNPAVPDGSRRVFITEHLTGGMTWGDSPTDAFDLFTDGYTALYDLAPGLAEALGLYADPFTAYKAAVLLDAARAQ